MTAGDDRILRRRAHELGIQLSYTAQGGRRMRTSIEALRATMAALGDPVADQRSLLEPVVVRRADGLLSAPVTVPAGIDLARLTLTVTDGDAEVFAASVADLVEVQAATDDAGQTVELTVSIASADLATGYYDVHITGGSAPATALLLVPPRRAPEPGRGFGLFAPLYGLRGEDDGGVGTFSDLGALAEYVGTVGGDLLGTLPMLATDWTPPVDPSPYLPVSRLFLNEIFIDLEALPELAASPQARALLASDEFRRQAAALSAEPMVGYADVMAMKRKVLERCAEALFASSGDRRGRLDDELASRPELSSYAGFRATAEQQGNAWRSWSQRPGELEAGTRDSSAARYHQYVQLVADEQLRAAGDGNSRAGLYLDLPVGVHPDGFDTWAHDELFAAATVGAPPDRLAPQGQAWGFPPLHPQRIRRDRYRYIIACFRRLFTYSRAIRIDHVLGLQRLFWIPSGADASAGAYVRYRDEELRAIVAIEADRAGAVVVGEDLGTVSPSMRQAMDRDGMLHTFVYQFAASADRPFPQPRMPSMASLGTHDVARFASYWKGGDIDDRVERGVTSPKAAAADHDSRRSLVAAVGETSTHDALVACAGSLADGPAAYVMVDLADIEGEVVPDNRPGTGPEADNWRWRQKRTLPEITGDPGVEKFLADIAKRRRHPEQVGVSA